MNAQGPKIFPLRRIGNSLLEQTMTHSTWKVALDEVGWWNGISDMKSQPVAELAPNGNGIYDMSGNIREWVYDWYLPLTEDTAINPVVYFDEGVYPVERGHFICLST